jgi:diguanylate cyclase (GGDEF)-like protein
MIEPEELAEADRTEDADERRTIVVAEDDEVTRMMLCQVLDKYRVVAAASGEVAYQAALRELPDLVLLDWLMPGMDGITVLKMLKADSTTRTIPIVMLSSQTAIEQKVHAIEAGAQDFMTKPFSSLELITRIDQLLYWRESVAMEVSTKAALLGHQLTQAHEKESARIAAEMDRLEKSAMRDALTGLPNLLLLRDRMDQAILISKRRQEHFATLFLDIDGFKAINDNHGHAVGDEVLQIVGARLKGSLRESDTVARIGGDEFVVLAPNIIRPQNARELAARLLEAVREPIRIADAWASVSASIGVSLYPLDATDRDALIHFADTAMYVSKRLGKGRSTFASEDFFNAGDRWGNAFRLGFLE